MKRSNPSAVSGHVESSDSSGGNSVGASNSQLSESAPGIADPRVASSETPAGDGSLRYRIAALIAMLLLALAGLAIGLYLRLN